MYRVRVRVRVRFGRRRGERLGFGEKTESGGVCVREILGRSLRTFTIGILGRGLPLGLTGNYEGGHWVALWVFRVLDWIWEGRKNVTRMSLISCFASLQQTP